MFQIMIKIYLDIQINEVIDLNQMTSHYDRMYRQDNLYANNVVETKTFMFFLPVHNFLTLLVSLFTTTRQLKLPHEI